MTRLEKLKALATEEAVKLKQRGLKYHSPIECLIIDPEAGHEAAKKLIAFLKDETQTLEL